MWLCVCVGKSRKSEGQRGERRQRQDAIEGEDDLAACVWSEREGDQMQPSATADLEIAQIRPPAIRTLLPGPAVGGSATHRLMNNVDDAEFAWAVPWKRNANDGVLRFHGPRGP